MRPLRLAVVGCGGIFRNRMLPALQARDDVCITALVDPAPASLDQARAQGLDDARAFASLEEALQGDLFDAAYVSSPNHLHVPQAEALLAAGRHVLVEKPLATGAAQGARLAEAAEHADAICMVAYMAKFNAYNVAAAEVVRSGEIGPVRCINACFSFHFDDQTQWRCRPECGGGVLGDLGVYCLTMVRDLMDARPICVESVCLPRPGPDAVEMAARACITYSNGARVNVSTSFWAPALASCEVWGERGTVTVTSTWFQNGRGEAVVGHVDGRSRRLAPEEQDPYAAELAHFLRLVDAGEKPDARFSVAGALEDLRVMDAIKEASRTGRPVHLAEGACT